MCSSGETSDNVLRSTASAVSAVRVVRQRLQWASFAPCLRSAELLADGHEQGVVLVEERGFSGEGFDEHVRDGVVVCIRIDPVMAA